MNGPPDVMQSKVQQTWDETVKQFIKCDSTFEDDRLMAISANARSRHKEDLKVGIEIATWRDRRRIVSQITTSGSQRSSLLLLDRAHFRLQHGLGLHRRRCRVRSGCQESSPTWLPNTSLLKPSHEPIEPPSERL